MSSRSDQCTRDHHAYGNLHTRLRRRVKFRETTGSPEGTGRLDRLVSLLSAALSDSLGQDQSNAPEGSAQPLDYAPSVGPTTNANPTAAKGKPSEEI